MSFTYDNPTGSELEAVRLKIGDTDSDFQQLSDEEIEYELTEANGSILLASSRCASSLAAKYSRKVTKKIGGMSINYSDLAEQYRKLAADLLEQYNSIGYAVTVPEVGKVADAANYPKEFEHTDLAAPEWDADAE